MSIHAAYGVVETAAAQIVRAFVSDFAGDSHQEQCRDHRRDDGYTEYAVRRKRLDVGMDTCATSAILTVNTQRFFH
jgi:hypothetical protein